MGRKRKPEPTDGWTSWWSYQAVVGPIQTWVGDFMDMAGERHAQVGTDRRKWPPRDARDLVVTVDVRPGEMPNDKLFEVAKQHLGYPFLGDCERTR